MTNTKSHVVLCSQQPLQKIVVFNDRAELRREIHLQLEKGQNDVTIENVADSLIEDSVRVTGRGAASIQEVQVKQKRSVPGEKESERVAALREAVEAAQVACQTLSDRQEVLSFRQKTLDESVASLCKASGKDENGRASKSSDENIQDIKAYFEFHGGNSQELRQEKHKLEKQLKDAIAKKQVAEEEYQNAINSEYQKVISVLLESGGGGEVLLELSYQVHNASWTPFYDIRVDTSNEKTLQLFYYANVMQWTGEDWGEGQLVLSTAQPCLGGNIPELGVLEASFYRPPPPPPVPMMYDAMQCSAGNYAESSRRASKKMMLSAPMAAMAQNMAAVNERSLSTEYTISRPAYIPSDMAQHKVTIGVAELSPELTHEAVPCKSPSAFLTASCVNTSGMALLPGAASVYLDAAFVAKTHLKAVSPGERFTSSLGVDPAVKIEYKPAHCFSEQTGVINKWTSMSHEQKVMVKNTKSDDILLTIREHIPRSTDEKIKVKIVSPENVSRPNEDAVGGNGSAPTPGVRLLANSHHLEWTVRVEKNSGVTLPVRWQIDYPQSEKILLNEAM